MKPSFFDPVGRAGEAIDGRRAGSSVYFDWIDALLLFGGMLAQVVLTLIISSRMPALEQSLENDPYLLRVVSFVLATVFAFGPLVVRRRLFPFDAGRRPALREGILFRLMSVAGLLFVAAGMFCMFILSGVLYDPPAESYEAFSERVGAEMLDLTDLQVMGEVQDTLQRGGDSAELEQAVARGEDLSRSHRQDYIDARWEAHQQWRSEQDAIAGARRQRIMLSALIAFGLGSMLLRARVDRAPAGPAHPEASTTTAPS